MLSQTGYTSCTGTSSLYHTHFKPLEIWQTIHTHPIVKLLKHLYMLYLYKDQSKDMKAMHKLHLQLLYVIIQDSRETH